MIVQPVNGPKTPIGQILEAAGSDRSLLESEDERFLAVIPLDDDLIDYLIERSPRFCADCRETRQRMEARRSQTHDDVRNQFAEE
jgi:hypothetical protein